MVEIRELIKRFGALTAVERVSLDVKEGETFALLGPNGSGKTTVLKCIAGLVLPDSGTIRVGGADISREAKCARSRLSYMPQRISLDDNMTARELIRFYSRLRKLPDSRAEFVLANDMFGLSGFADMPVSKYSGGMIQRLGIAIALLPDSPLLILDEPASSLDPEGVIQLRNILRHLSGEGRTILFSSHRLLDVELLANRVAVLVDGRLAAMDTVSKLQSELTEGVHLRIILEIPESRFVGIVRAAGASEAVLVDNTLVVSCEPGLRHGVLLAVQKAGGVIKTFSTNDATIEEIYLNYVKRNCSGHSADDIVGMRNRPRGTGGTGDL